MINSFKNPAIMRILRTTERHGAGWREQNFIPHDEAIRLTDSPQTRMKPGFVRNQVYYSYNNFTANENPWMKRHGTAGTLAVPFCHYDMELNKQ